MAEEKEHIEVVAGILWRGGKLLAVQRPPGKVYAGWWEFPGGKIEPDEIPEDALKRELEEELGVTVQEISYYAEAGHEYPEKIVSITFFDIFSFGGEPTALEGQAMAWLWPAEAADYRFLEADVEIVCSLKERGPISMSKGIVIDGEGD